MYYTEWHSPLGMLTLVATPDGLRGIYFADHRHPPDRRGWQRDDGYPALQEAISQLAAYFSGQLQQFSLKLDRSGGTAFQQRVWQALEEIPYGQTWSYQQLARHLGQDKAVRAVGAANGRNPLSIVVPCHRVIAASGALTGYAGGLENKMQLLKLEAERSDILHQYSAE